MSCPTDITFKLPENTQSVAAIGILYVAEGQVQLDLRLDGDSTIPRKTCLHLFAQAIKNAQKRGK